MVQNQTMEPRRPAGRACAQATEVPMRRRICRVLGGTWPKPG
ncbi:hypothetical protein Ga0080574_TMP520 (plasmid) [Salipiger abyssi]|uniref:Uncharacterized protein n=1 Tax=Salipiger abyssi TaxID=1250539 RepID=A0A1P8UN67_9RHOB|nr:hypothetical protein Ga0080574_TMP520 [Salipiger abyssi]